MPHLEAERLSRTEENLAWLKKQPELLKSITDWHLDYQYPYIPETDAEARLYLDGFQTAEEAAFCRQFHAATPDEKARLTLKRPDGTLKTLATRLIGRYFPTALSGALAADFNQFLAQAFSDQEAHAPVDFRGNRRLTPRTALETIQSLRQENLFSPEDQTLLTDYEHYLNTCLPVSSS